MKTKQKSRSTAVFALLLSMLAFTPMASKAQTIHNQLTCAVEVQVEFRNGGSCNVYCNNYTIGSIPGGAIVAINTALCPSFCDISITITKVGGTPSSGRANFSMASPGVSVTSSPPSTCLTALSAVYYGGTQFEITP